jgi:hypothetical protein
MRYNTLITASMLLLATGEVATAGGVIPNFNPVLNSASANLGTPVAADYTFDQSGLNGQFASNPTNNGWTLTVTGTGSGAFYTPNTASIDTVSNIKYTLTAYFDNSGKFLSNVGNSYSALTITGALSDQTAGVTGVSAATGYSSLFSSNLTDFGYNASQATIGFTTQFQASAWSSQAPFTGGSSGDVIYLFNQGGVSTGFGVLSGLISEFETGKFAPTSLANVESLAAVPLPMSAVLFGTGLIGLISFGRQNRKHSKSI